MTFAVDWALKNKYLSICNASVFACECVLFFSFWISEVLGSSDKHSILFIYMTISSLNWCPVFNLCMQAYVIRNDNSDEGLSCMWYSTLEKGVMTRRTAMPNRLPMAQPPNDIISLYMLRVALQTRWLTLIISGTAPKWYYLPLHVKKSGIASKKQLPCHGIARDDGIKKPHCE